MKKTYTTEEIEWLLNLSKDVVSLNTPMAVEQDDAHTELGDFIVDPNPGPDDELLQSNRASLLYKYLNQYLNTREQTVICKRFGLEDGVCYTLEEVGQHFGLSRERVRQIEARALRKLRYGFMKNKVTWENI